MISHFVVMAFSLLCLLTLTQGCKSNPHKAEVLQTDVDKATQVSNNEIIAVDKEGDMIYQKKLIMSEEIRKLHNDVYETEDRVYGTRKYRTQGLRGKYADCLKTLRLEQKDKLPALDKIDRWSDKDEEIKIGIDPSKDQLAAVTEEKLKDRIAKFQEYRRTLQQKEDDLTENIRACHEIRKQSP